MDVRLGWSLRALVGLLTSALFLWLALREIDFLAVLAAMGGADYIYLLPAVLLTYTVLLVRSLRWRLFLLSVQGVGIWAPFRATILGFMINFLLPVRAGEVIRAYVLGSREGMSKGAAFATIIVERIVDAISIMAVFVGFTLFVGFPRGGGKVEEALRAAALTFSAGAGVGLGVVIFIRLRGNLLLRVTRGLLGPFSERMRRRVEDLLFSFSRGLSLVQGMRRGVGVLLYTGLLWSLTVAGILLVARAFRLGLSWEGSVLLLVALAFGVSVPSGPAFVGTFHYAAVLSLGLYGIPRVEALGYAVVLHATSVLPVILLGLIFMVVEGGASLLRLKGVSDD